MTLRVAITGASGFVGQALASRLMAEGCQVTGVVRRELDAPFAQCVVSGLDDPCLEPLLAECDVLVHAAARAHVMDEDAAAPLAAYRAVNVDGSLAIARRAAAQGVRRFVFISSIKVNGEATPLGQPFRHDAKPAPEDAYGISKLEAEQGLTQLASDTGMELVIIRPPLVYGPGVKGNFAGMLKVVSKGLPLPLGRVDNRRSLVGLDNLVDLIRVCLDHPAATGQVFLVSDGEDLSTADLLRRAGQALDKPARLLPVPIGLLRLGATLLGKKAVADRLLGSLQVALVPTCERLGWQPPITVDEGLQRCCAPTKRGE
ncbi:UDP-glucose 4-epimerase family protein [Alcanivorax sp. IL3]|uniref:UDP-glucose 4-epimerase family protein n=1 Tax=unclassified Alcanivorax TaxID=2638842 RepID=UPI0039C03C42